MNYIIVSYGDALRLNEIIFDNYIANLVDVTKTALLIAQIQAVLSANNIVLTVDQQQWLDFISLSDSWVLTLGEAMLNTYQVREVIGLPFNFQIDTPAELNIIKYLPGNEQFPGWMDGTYSYFALAFVDPLQSQTLPVTDLVIYASTDPNVSLDDRKFIQSLIGQ